MEAPTDVSIVPLPIGVWCAPIPPTQLRIPSTWSDDIWGRADLE
jgi:hypothetical protein